jgi:hypothetical protein
MKGKGYCRATVHGRPRRGAGGGVVVIKLVYGEREKGKRGWMTWPTLPLVPCIDGSPLDQMVIWSKQDLVNKWMRIMNISERW